MGLLVVLTKIHVCSGSTTLQLFILVSCLNVPHIQYTKSTSQSTHQPFHQPNSLVLTWFMTTPLQYFAGWVARICGMLPNFTMASCASMVETWKGSPSTDGEAAGGGGGACSKYIQVYTVSIDVMLDYYNSTHLQRLYSYVWKINGIIWESIAINTVSAVSSLLHSFSPISFAMSGKCHFSSSFSWRPRIIAERTYEIQGVLAMEIKHKPLRSHWRRLLRWSKYLQPFLVIIA